MSSGLVLSLIILAVISGSLWYIIGAEGGLQLFPALLKRVGITLPKLSVPALPERSFPSPIPHEFSSGNSRFSQGSCRADTDCQISGCSAEVCGKEPAITTCEYSESFPNATKYICGCNKGICGWRGK